MRQADISEAETHSSRCMSSLVCFFNHNAWTPDRPAARQGLLQFDKATSSS